MDEADIALASAETAAAFEIDPYVAMLSYSTGDSDQEFFFNTTEITQTMSFDVNIASVTRAGQQNAGLV